MARKGKHKGTPPSPFAQVYDVHASIVADLCKRKGKARDIFGLERIVLIVISAIQLGLPITFLRAATAPFGELCRYLATDIFVVSKPCILLFMLSEGYTQSAVALGFVVYLMTDMYTSLLGIELLARFWPNSKSSNRAFMLLTCNLVETVVAFAILYAHYDALIFHEPHDWTDILYFSAVTSATVGYGDIIPAPGTGRHIAIIQIFVSLLFMGLVFTRFVSRMGGSGNDRENQKSRTYAHPTLYRQRPTRHYRNDL
jgi:hypothetical protein